jgi:hypothetical protein
MIFINTKCHDLGVMLEKKRYDIEHKMAAIQKNEI